VAETLELTRDLLTAQEVADILRVHLYTVYKLLGSGSLKGFRIRRRWRIEKTELQNFMSRQDEGEDPE